MLRGNALKRQFLHNLAICFVASGFAFAQSNKSADLEWRVYGHDPGGMKFSPLRQINRTNVSQLKRVWTYHTGEVKPGTRSTEEHRIRSIECTPLVVDGVLYLTTPYDRVIALDAETGKEFWEFDPQSARKDDSGLLHSRGAAYWEGPSSDGRESDKRILFGTFDAQLIELDAQTGKLCPNFGKGGAVNLREGVADHWPEAEYSVTSPPAIYKDLVITGCSLQESPSLGPSGAVRAFDIRTGKLVWKFDTVPGPGKLGHDTWEGDSWKDRSGTNVWSMMSVDVERGMVFLPVSSPSYDFYGGDRKGQNLFGDTLVALDAVTGRLIWYYQIIHHDIWDYDLPAQPTLITVRRDGQEIPAVAVVTKSGFLFAFDRLTGKPLFPVEERPVPQSDVPGEATWPTQPIPLKPPPLARQSLTPDDLTTVMPELRKYCTETLRAILPKQAYTPYGLELTVVMPGTLGGATWSGGSFDPSTGYYYVNVNEVGGMGTMKAEPAGSPLRYRRASHWGEYARFWDKNHYPCQQPPWGTLNAIDLNSGEIVWKVPLGVVDELLAHGIPQTGALNLGGSIVTAGGLVFIGSSNDSRFRAFDARTGKELWVTKLEASSHATPITFLGKRTGKQVVVIAASGGGYFSSTASDTVVAYALPE